MKKKRLLASIVTAAMLFTMVPSYALADDSTVQMIDLVPATPTESTQTDVPDGTECTAEVHQEGCPAAKPVAEEPEAETEIETDKQTPCTKTEGCTLLDGHEGDCEVPEGEPEQKQEDEEVPANEPVMLDMDIPKETCTVDYSKQQSEGVTYDGYEYDETQKIYKFHYTISENAGDELVIDLSQCALQMGKEAYQSPGDHYQSPGDHYKFQIFIENKSQNTYKYKDNSFVLAPGDTSDFGSLDEGSLLPVLTYDGQYMPIRLSGAMIPYYFYKDVFGVSSSGEVTFEMMCQIYDYLDKKGYTGESAITDYMLDYYNAKRKVDYDSLLDLFADHPDWVEGNLVTSNGIWTMTEDTLLEYIDKYPWIDRFVSVKPRGSKLSVQIKWPEPELTAVSYNSFYCGLFSVVYGKENVETLNPNGAGVEFSRAHGVGDYLDGTDLYNETNAYFSGLASQEKPFKPGDTLEVWSGYGLDGPGMGNVYQNYEFTYYNTIELENVGHKVQYYFEGHYPEEAELPEVANYQADATVTIADDPEEVEDWKFLGWEVRDTIEVSEDLTFKMPDRDVAIVGQWEFVGEETSTDWDVSKSKTATNLVQTEDGLYESDITLSLPSAQETLESDVVFVLDKSTSADVEDQMIKMLEDLNTQAEETGAVINVSVVIFNKEAHRKLGLTQLTTENMSKIEAAIKTEISSGTNTHAGLLAGKAMLDADKDVAANRKYLIFVSDGITYMYNEEPTVTAWSFLADAWYTWAGPDNWNSKYGTNKAPDNWNAWMADIGAKVTAQGTTYEYPYGGTVQTATPKENWQTYANSIDKALYLTNSVYQDAQSAGYHCYAVKASSNATYPWGPSFMNYLADGKTVSFADIQNDIYYLLSAGSEVVDVIGSGIDNKDNPYNFDFVNNIDKLTLKVGKETLSKTELIDPQFSDPYVTSAYGFGEPMMYIDGESMYPYVLKYYAEGQYGDSDECLVWDINVPVSNFAPVQLTYTVKLTNPKTEPGTYGVYDADGSEKKDSLHTNNSATLYPMDSNGDEGVPENFAKPTVSYTVPENTVTVTFKPGAHGDLRGAAGEDISYEGIEKGNSLGADQSVPRVDEDDDWDFTEWLCTEGSDNMEGRTYTAAEIADLVFTVDTDFVAQYEEESGGGGAHHPDAGDGDDDDNDRDDDTEEIIDEEVPLAETPWLNTVDHYAYIVGYPEDYVTGQPTEDESRWPVKPQANISRAEVATIFFRLLTDEARDQFWMTTNNFPDVAPDAWYNNAISTMVNAGIIQGYEDGTFRPNNNITRAEFAAIASRFMSSGYDVEEDLFTDIANHWARENINDAAMTQWIHGYPDGTFLPDQAITRAEAVTLVNNVLQRKPDADHMFDSMIKWPDNPEGTWYYEAIQEATNSHDYDLFEDAEYETWTALQENRDWAALEKDWVNTHRTGGEVA